MNINKGYQPRYICNCLKVTLKDVEAAIDNGAESFRDIHQATRLGGKCGACLPYAREVVALLLAEKAAATRPD